MDEVERLAAEHKPKMIVAGWSAYPRQLDFPRRFREIADSVGALLMVNMAHFAGLVAANEHPSPVPHADVVTTTVHNAGGSAQRLDPLQGGEHQKAIDKAIFPGQQGGPLMHTIAAKAVALRIAGSESVFRANASGRPIANARAFARGPGSERHPGPHRRHRRPPGAGRPDPDRARRPDRRGPPRGGRDHRQPQRDPLRRAAADEPLRACASAPRR